LSQTVLPYLLKGRNLLFICNHYNIVDTLGLLANRRRYNSVMSRVMTHLNMRYTDVNDDNFNVLMELLMIKNGIFTFNPTHNCFSSQDIDDLIIDLSTN
jgi:hypothetical protein